MTDLAQHFDVSDQGSIVMLYPQTPQARKFLEEEVQAESWQYIGGGLAVEPSYVEDLIEGFLGHPGGSGAKRGAESGQVNCHRPAWAVLL